MCSTARIDALIDELECEIQRVHDAGLGDELVEIRRVCNRLEAVFAHALVRFDHAREFATDGAVSTVSWLRHRCRLSSGNAAEKVTLARRLAELPGTDAALTSGVIDYQHAALIARTADKVGADNVLAGENTLLVAARQMDAGAFAAQTRFFQHCIDADGTLADANQDHEKRRLHLSQSLGGIFFLDGLLDAEGGAMLQSALRALSGPLPEDNRTPAQRRADALVELARRQLDGGGLPQAGGQKPHLTVLLTEETLKGAAAGEVDRLPLPAETVRRLACDCALTPIVMNEAGQPIAMGGARRTVSPSQARALRARDRMCRFPGCDRTPDWTRAHHLRHWADGGPTILPNLALLCGRHHWLVHEGRWRLVGGVANLQAVPP